uniref:Uncharacterized protein n=1 Tax=Grammatophora oceanica TaxID=210454 RepID=A0A7S1VMX3_9STRA|mmetsp:Transcript_49727/g.74122  ORF Transcript_49727/g.74122 Transcript_49727/m.74122 type:complete len:122 (+) Transcript_49727:142-507(+)
MGLQELSKFFSHPHTKIMKIDGFPRNYPDGYNLPFERANKASYYDRGWPFFETSLAAMSQNNYGKSIVADVSASGDGRGAHTSRLTLLPDEFEECLSQRTFTNSEVDLPRVQELYKAELLP